MPVPPPESRQDSRSINRHIQGSIQPGYAVRERRKETQQGEPLPLSPKVVNAGTAETGVPHRGEDAELNCSQAKAPQLPINRHSAKAQEERLNIIAGVFFTTEGDRKEIAERRGVHGFSPRVNWGYYYTPNLQGEGKPPAGRRGIA